MGKSGELLISVFDYLNKNVNYAVLRNFEGLPEKNISRDIDIIINKKDYKKHKNVIIDIINNSGWKLITYLNSDRLMTFVCGYVTLGKTELIQWDFFFNTSVFGVELLTAKELLQNREFNGFLYHVSRENEFLDKYLYDRVVGASYPEKYDEVKRDVKDNRLVLDKIKSLLGVISVEECDKVGKRKLLFHALRHNLLFHPFRQIGNCFSFMYTFARNYVCSNTGFTIGFTGPDGSGKTTVIEGMIEQLGDVFRKAHILYHFRPTMLGNLGEVAHNTGLKKEVDREYDRPHRGGKTGKINSFCRLCYYSVDYILGYFLRVKSQTRITRLVFFDRYFTDIIVDSRRSRIHLNCKFLYWFGRFFIPSLNYNILLTASSEVILKRKQELDAEGIRSINEKIEYLKNKHGYKKILNESTSEVVIAEILSYVLDKQHGKNMKRFTN